MDDDDDSDADFADRRDPLGVPSLDKALPVVFYGAIALWAVVVAINVWTALSSEGMVNVNAPVALRWQFIASAVASAWGYLLIAGIALVARAVLRDRG
jgi:hypothetical protein